MNPADAQLQTHLAQLKLAYVLEHYQSLADQAAQQHWTPVDYLSRLIEGEALRQMDRTVRRRMVAARFPVLKTLEQFNWSWPKKINRPQVQNLFRLAFLENHANVIFMGAVGLGKTHLAVALGYAACQQQHTVLYVTAVEVVNTQLQQLLESFDRRTSLSKRDYAITLCLARLGLRAGEVARLRLEDLDWRNGQLRLAAPKGRRERHLPLPAEVGQALATYLQHWAAEAGLTVHPTKTRIVQVQSEGFDFLGWHFRGDKKWPRKKSLQKL